MAVAPFSMLYILIEILKPPHFLLATEKKPPFFLDPDENIGTAVDVVVSSAVYKERPSWCLRVGSSLDITRTDRPPPNAHKLTT